MDRESFEALTQSLYKLEHHYEHPARDQLGPYLDAICEGLAECGVRTVVVTYDGAGDEGWVESPVFEPSGAEIPEELTELITALVEHCLPPGWEINDGSRGTVTIDPATVPRARFDHVNKIEEVDPRPFTVRGEADPELRGLLGELRQLGTMQLDFTYSFDAVALRHLWFHDRNRHNRPADLQHRLEAWISTILATAPGQEGSTRGEGQVLLREELVQFDHQVISEQTAADPFTID